MRVGWNGHGVLSTIPKGIACAKIITCIATATYIVSIVGLELTTLSLSCKSHTHANTRSLTIVLCKGHSVGLSTTCRNGQTGARTDSLKPEVTRIILVRMLSVSDKANLTVERLSNA